jgi:hypothetical protein
MRIRLLHKLLLVAVLAIGQWLAIAHDYQHPATAGDQACQVCVHGQTLQAGPASLPALAVNWLSTEAPPAIQPDPTLTRRHAHARIRAPPACLV